MKKIENQFSIIDETSVTETVFSLAEQVQVVHAFADTRYDGNPAGVLGDYPDPDPAEMAALARYMDLPIIVTLNRIDTARYGIRWFTKNAELALCGHGTMAASYVLFNDAATDVSRLSFETVSSGTVTAELHEGLITMILPSLQSEVADEATSQAVRGILNVPIDHVRQAEDDLIAVLENDTDLVALIPDLGAISKLNCRGLIVTAQTNPQGTMSEFDIVSRFFAPQIGIDEDEVCISAHCKLQPFWQGRLGADHPIRALQASSNGGSFLMHGRDDKVIVTGSSRKTTRTTRTELRQPPTRLDCLETMDCGIRAVMTELSERAVDDANKHFSMAYFEVEPGGMTEPHEHSVSEIWCITAGKAEIIADRLSNIVEAGSFVHLKPKSSHQLRNIGRDVIKAVSIWWQPGDPYADA